jgi:thymidylate synthase
MHVIQGSNNRDAMLKLYKLVANAPEITSRGSKSRNVHNVAVVLNTGESVITNFVHRKMNLAYAKREWLWYLGADPKDDSICEHATAWKKLQQEDGTFYSNYGQYLFGEQHLGRPNQFEYIIRTLKDDPQSRRASMMLLKVEHLFPANTDTVCTYAINFFIDQGHLCMTVMMRSNDVIWGFTNDAFCFWQLYLFVYHVLKNSMPLLKYGSYTHMANSMHVYDRHYEMIRSILLDPNYRSVTVPMPSGREALQLVLSRGKEGEGEYTKWLKTFD